MEHVEACQQLDFQLQTTLEKASRCSQTEYMHKISSKSENSSTKPGFQVYCTNRLTTTWCWFENKTKVIVSLMGYNCKLIIGLITLHCNKCLLKQIKIQI